MSSENLNRGYTLAGALCLIAVMSIFMALAVQSWTWVKQRDNEEELIFRGREYVEAIARYHAKFNSFPPDLETLQKLKFIRKLYKDPMTKSGKWKALRPDSVVETGAAGQINQPGTQGKDQNDQENQGNQPGRIPTGFGNSNGSDQNSSSDSGEQTDSMDKDKNSDEEPESETTGPIVGVVSRSKKNSIKVYNNQTTYNKWYFISASPQVQQQPQNPPPKKDDKGGKQTTPPPQQQQQGTDPDGN